MQVTVGECHPKKILCMLGALQSAFREPAFLPKGGDALSLDTITHMCRMFRGPSNFPLSSYALT